MVLAGPLIAAREGHNPLSGLAHSLLEAYESLLMVVGNLPSFLRIMALAMAHSSLTLAVAEVSKLMAEAGAAGLVAAAIVYVLGNLAIAGMEGLLAFAHATRLHFYEWFSKFYSGTGIPYTPVRLEGVIVRLA
jgi:V/A-type H+-transporting ATPase subunit I